MPVYAFVDSIDASPTVLLDLDDQDPLTVEEGVDTSPPRRRASVFGSASRDGDVVSQKSYSDRTLVVPLSFKLGTSAEVQSEVMQQLGRLLDGPQWLKWQHDGKTAPVFFRTKFGDIQVDDEIGEDPPQRRITLTIAAEPFAYGLRESGTVAINNDPTHATNPMSYVFPAVLGDVATPLVMDVAYGSFGTSLAVASVAMTDAIPAPIFRSTSGITGGAPAGWTYTSSFADAGAIGGTCLRLQRASGATEVGGAALHDIDVEEPGDYRLFLLAQGGSDQSIAVSQQFAGDPAVTHEVSLDTGSLWRWLDLGVFRCPTDYPVVDESLVSSTFGNDNATFTFVVTNTNTQETRLSAWVLVPAGLDRSHSATFGLVETGGEPDSSPLRFDGISKAAYYAPSAPSAGVINGDTRYAGALPQVVPGKSNQLFLLQPATAKTVAADVDYFYFPRYLYDRPAAT